MTECPSRNADAITAFERIDAALKDLAHRLGAAEMQYPVLISRATLDQAEYPQAFPHLLMHAAPAMRPECSCWSLSPAVCYHTYSQFAGQFLAEPIVVTARGRCFRHESTFHAGERQIEFEMREIVLIGSPDWITSSAASARDAVEALARAFGLLGEWQAAEDPFFLPAAAGKAAMQRLLQTKIEYVCPDPRPLALASVNFHRDFFTRRFNIHGPQTLHTACIAAGLDRWASRAAVVKPEESPCTI